MRRIAVLVATVALTMSGLALTPAQAKAKVTKPSAPSISAISSSAVKKGKVNVTITITLPVSDGGSKITGSKVNAGGKSCTIAKTKTSCTIKAIKNGKALTVAAKSKNKKGFSSPSTSVGYTAGASAWPTAPVATIIADAPAASSPVAAPAPLTCATGGMCAVGDRGPGGGIVYYVDITGFSCGENYTTTGSPTGGLCRYLEVAPSGWNTGADPVKAWATGTSTSGNAIADVDVIINETNANDSRTAIGLGLKNSMAIVTQNGVYDATNNDYAAGAARAYAGNSLTDWYLPTTTELNLLCQWARNVPQGVGTDASGGAFGAVNGGFAMGEYWASSEFDADSPWFQEFGYGYYNWAIKWIPYHVRPVRAF